MEIDFQVEVKRSYADEACYCKPTACLGIFCMLYKIVWEVERNRRKESFFWEAL